MTEMIGEALRYLGVTSDPEGETRGRLTALMEELRGRIVPRHVLRVMEIRRRGGELTLGEQVPLPGKMARDMLRECERAVLLVCTLGPAFEARARTAKTRSMTEAVLLDALGSAWVEAACDEAERELAARFPALHLTDRFSPGYGDLPLNVQPDVLAATDAARRLGVQATESFLMIPQKTVTAVIGLSDKPQPASIRGCAHCPMRGTCGARKGGTTCEV